MALGAILGGAASIAGSLLGSKSAGDAADARSAASDAQLQYMKEAEDRARQDISQYYPRAEILMNRGYNQQRDMLGQAMPVTANLFQQGNIGAQDILAGSMPQYQNAILGGNVDYSFAQPRQIDTSGMQELAQYGQNQDINPFSFEDALADRLSGSREQIMQDILGSDELDSYIEDQILAGIEGRMDSGGMGSGGRGDGGSPSGRGGVGGGANGRGGSGRGGMAGGPGGGGDPGNR